MAVPGPGPDLSSILSSLITHPVQSYPTERQAPIAEDDSEYDPAQFNPAQLPHSEPTKRTESAPDLQALYPDLVPNTKVSSGRPAVRNATPSKKPASADSITTYAAALRYITSTLMPKPHFTPRIRHLIDTQKRHEREWYEGRQKLVKQLENRDVSRKKLDEVLASVGGRTLTVNTADATTGELSKAEELKVYDRKIWRAQKEMVEAAERELEKLGVPFFGEGVHRVWEGKEDEMRELRQKVIGLLEDLCGSDEDNGSQ